MNQSTSHDYKRHAILFVDDEEKARKYFHRLFDDSFWILDAADGVEAVAIYERHADEIGVIVTDQRMPNLTGSEFLAKLGARAQNVVKILSTAYADLEAAVDSVNRGGIYRYVSKPWDIPDMELTLKRALELYEIKRERDVLVGAKMQAVGHLLFATRLASFALVPVAAGAGCRRAAEAVAAFTRLGAAVAQESETGGLSGIGDWRKIHARQREFAAMLEAELAKALAAAGDADAAKSRFLETLAEACGIEVEAGDGGMITMAGNPFPMLLAGALAVAGAPDARSARVLAALMAAYHQGVKIDRKWARSGLQLQFGTVAVDQAEDSPGDAVAAWLFDDELLMSSAVGLL